MKHLLALFAVALLCSWTARAQGTNAVSTNDFVRLRVTVVDVAPLRNSTGFAAPIGDVDPRFALTLRIESCIPAIANLKSGSVFTFAVHSPSRFRRSGDVEKGKTNEVTMLRTKAVNLFAEGKK